MNRILRGVAASLALFVAGAAAAQTPRPLSNPNFRLVDGASVYASARHPDGGATLIGDFSSISSVQRSGIARLRPDGSVDPSWGSGVGYQHYPEAYNRPVITTDASGAVYVAGIVISSGESYIGLVKLSASTGDVVADWRSSAGTFPFLSLAADGSGVYVGNMGAFHKISVETGATEWSAPYTAISLALDGRGAIYAVVADYGSNPPRQFIARFSADTGVLDVSWSPTVILVDGWSQPLALDACGSVYIAGRLVVISEDQPHDRVLKISVNDGRVDSNWGPGIVAGVNAIATDADCSVYLGGRFETIGGVARKNMAKLSHDDGHVVNDWLPEGACCDVSELASDAQGRITVAGSLRRIGKQTRLGFASLDAISGEAGPATDAESWPLVTAIATDPAGGVIVGGSFAKAGSQSRHGLLRLRANGTLDTHWAPSMSMRYFVQVTALAVRPEGGVYVGGHPGETNLEARRYAVRFTGSNGALDPEWNPALDAAVEAFAFGPDGSIYAGGSFLNVSGQPQASIAKLSADTGFADPDWNPQAGGPVFAIAVDVAGAVYVGGFFNEFGGQEHWHLAKIDSVSGNVLHGWAGGGGMIGSVSTLAATDTAVYASAGELRKFLTTDGAPDPTWSSLGTIGTLGFAVAADGSIYAATRAEGALKRYLADTGAEDPAWNVSPPSDLTGPIAIDRRGTVYVGVGGPSALAAYSVDTVFFDPFDP